MHNNFYSCNNIFIYKLAKILEKRSNENKDNRYRKLYSAKRS